MTVHVGLIDAIAFKFYISMGLITNESRTSLNLDVKVCLMQWFMLTSTEPSRAFSRNCLPVVFIAIDAIYNTKRNNAWINNEWPSLKFTCLLATLIVFEYSTPLLPWPLSLSLWAFTTPSSVALYSSVTSARVCAHPEIPGITEIPC